MVAIGCSFEACLMSLTCKYEILENPMSTVGAPTLTLCIQVRSRNLNRSKSRKCIILRSWRGTLQYRLRDQ